MGALDWKQRPVRYCEVHKDGGRSERLLAMAALPIGQRRAPSDVALPQAEINWDR